MECGEEALGEKWCHLQASGKGEGRWDVSWQVGGIGREVEVMSGEVERMFREVEVVSREVGEMLGKWTG